MHLSIYTFEYIYLFYLSIYLSRPDLQRPEPVPGLPLDHHELRLQGAGPQLAQQLQGPQQTHRGPQPVQAGVLRKQVSIYISIIYPSISLYIYL